MSPTIPPPSARIASPRSISRASNHSSNAPSCAQFLLPSPAGNSYQWLAIPAAANEASTVARQARATLASVTTATSGLRSNGAQWFAASASRPGAIRTS